MRVVATLCVICVAVLRVGAQSPAPGAVHRPTTPAVWHPQLEHVGPAGTIQIEFGSALSERGFDWIHRGYEKSLGWVLRHPQPMLLVTILTIGVSVYLYIIVPKGFFPDQDTGRLMGNIQAAQDISFQEMRQKLSEVVNIILTDPAVDTVVYLYYGNAGAADQQNKTQVWDSNYKLVQHLANGPTYQY